ncbi:hypothetical protein [Streptomyces sp. BP-8]|uniref:MFS transporter n=1 Tax=Streptomyces sirii TaxID=3127701 RepID=A0ABZ2QUL3_9ACTN
MGYFIDALTAEPTSPTTPGELWPRHGDAFALKKADLATAGMVIGLLGSSMVNVDGLTSEFADAFLAATVTRLGLILSVATGT